MSIETDRKDTYEQIELNRRVDYHERDRVVSGEEWMSSEDVD